MPPLCWHQCYLLDVLAIATQAVADAKKAINTAKRANYVWRDSGKILKKAATKLANKAKRQGEMALAQSKFQASAGPL